MMCKMQLDHLCCFYCIYKELVCIALPVVEDPVSAQDVGVLRYSPGVSLLIELSAAKESSSSSVEGSALSGGGELDDHALPV